MVAPRKNQNSCSRTCPTSFLRYVNFRKGGSYLDVDYASLQNDLKLQTLSARRVSSDLKFLEKLLNNGINCPELLALVNFRVPSFLSRINPPFCAPFHHSNYGKNSPVSRLMHVANYFHEQYDVISDNPSAILKLNLDDFYS